jgi:hypothetical protein
LLIIVSSRYLTKIAHQVVALVSPEHAAHIIWKDDADDPMSDSQDDDDDDDDDRFFTFEVAKTKEETESARASDGFSVWHRY